MCLPLEDFIIRRVSEGYSIVLTGNAGDGKTHLLRRLELQLTSAGVIVEPDATAAMRGGDITPILNGWRKAITEDKPYCLAANEYPLYRLRVKGREGDHQCHSCLV